MVNSQGRSMAAILPCSCCDYTPGASGRDSRSHRQPRWPEVSGVGPRGLGPRGRITGDSAWTSPA